MRRNFFLVLACVVVLSAVGCQQHAEEHDHGTATASAPSTTSAPAQSAATAAPPTQPGKGKFMEFPSATGNARGYLSLPNDKNAKHPAVIVIQEWWGLNDWIVQQTDRFADQGYVALAVDLYRGKVTNSQDEAHELMRGLPEDRAVADLKSGFNLLAARPDVDPKRIGVIGWCMGGGYSLDLTLAEPRLAASVINYGHLVTDPNTIAKIRTPILGNFGAEDRGIPPADVQAFEKAVKAAGKPIDVKIYPGAGHAFMNPNNKGGYVESAAKDAWSRIDAFFAKHLRG